MTFSLFFRFTFTTWRRANQQSASAARREISPASTWETAPLICWCVETKTGGKDAKTPRCRRRINLSKARGKENRAKNLLRSFPTSTPDESLEAEAGNRGTGVQKRCEKTKLHYICALVKNLFPWQNKASESLLEKKRQALIFLHKSCFALRLCHHLVDFNSKKICLDSVQQRMNTFMNAHIFATSWLSV